MIDGSTAPTDTVPQSLADDIADVSFWTGYALGQLEADSTVVRFGSTEGVGRVSVG